MSSLAWPALVASDAQSRYTVEVADVSEPPYKLSDIRHTIFRDWHPPWTQIGGSHRIEAIVESWLELERVASVSAWSSVVLQAGRIAEASLSIQQPKQMGNEAAKQSRAPETLNSLLRNAYSPNGVLGTGERAASSIAGDNLRRLRNLAAHFNDLGGPTELSATQALVLLLVFVEAVSFGVEIANASAKEDADNLALSEASLEDDQSDNVNVDSGIRSALRSGGQLPDSWLSDQWSSVTPNLLSRWFIATSSSNRAVLLAGQEKQVAQYLFEASSRRCLARLPMAYAGQSSEATRAAADAIHSRFVRILKSLARGRSGNWAFFARLAGLGLPEHEKVVNALLPYDSAWLLRQIEEGASPHGVVRKVIKMKANSRQQWERLGSEAGIGAAIGAAAWSSLPISVSLTRNRILLARNLPLRLRTQILSHAPFDSLVEYISNVSQLARAIIEARFILGLPLLDVHQKDTIWRATLRRVEAASVQDLRNVPLVLWLSRGVEGFFAETILDMAIARDVSCSERRSAGRLLLVVWLCSPNHRRRVSARASDILRQFPQPVDWGFWLLTGVRELSGLGLESLNDDADFLQSLVDLAMPDDVGYDEVHALMLGIGRALPKANRVLRSLAKEWNEIGLVRLQRLPGHAELDSAVERATHLALLPSGQFLLPNSLE